MVSESLCGKALSLVVFSLLCLGCSVVLGNGHYQQTASYPQQNYYAVPAAHYQQQYQQPVASEDHRVVDEKDYDVGGFNYWYLCMPIVLIPLLLLLCTPLMHKPLDMHHGWGGDHGHQGYGYGYGNYDLHRMGENSKEEEVSERVLKSISSSPKQKRHSSKKNTTATQ